MKWKPAPMKRVKFSHDGTEKEIFVHDHPDYFNNEKKEYHLSSVIDYIVQETGYHRSTISTYIEILDD